MYPHQQWIKAAGWIKYDPSRPNLKRKRHWWAVVNMNDDIARYYRWHLLWHRGIKIHPPSWGAHISIIRGEKPPKDKMHLWKKYDGKRIIFEYSPIIRQSGDTTEDRPGNYWFIDVRCPLLVKIRQEFGFPFNFGFHLTIGRTW